MFQLKNETIGELLYNSVKRYGNQEALVYSKEGIRYTYQQFWDETSKVAKALMGLGVKKGEHIAIWATNVPEWVILQFASARIGAVLVTVNTSYQSSELEYLLRQSDSTTLFSIGGFKGTSFPKIITSIIDHPLNRVPLLKNLRLSFYKIPENIMFVEDYPMTESGKIQKYKLREWVVETVKEKI